MPNTSLPPFHLPRGLREELWVEMVSDPERRTPCQMMGIHPRSEVTLDLYHLVRPVLRGDEGEAEKVLRERKAYLNRWGR